MRHLTAATDAGPGQRHARKPHLLDASHGRCEPTIWTRNPAPGQHRHRRQAPGLEHESRAVVVGVYDGLGWVGGGGKVVTRVSIAEKDDAISNKIQYFFEYAIHEL